MLALRILIIHEVSYEKKVVYEFQDFAERLAKMGHFITVMDFDENGDGVRQIKKYSKTGLAEVTLENTPFLNIPILKYISGRINHAKNLRQKFKNNEVDVVFLYSVFISGTNTVRLAKKYKVPLVYRVLDVYHLLRQNPLFVLPLYMGERYIYRNATFVCLTNESMERYIHHITKIRASPIRILHHGVDMDHFKKEPVNMALMNELGFNTNDKVLFFLGTLYTFSGLDILLNNFDKIEMKVPNIKFLIVGGGDAEPVLKSIIETKQLENKVVLTGFKGYKELPVYMSIATIGLTPFFTNKITKEIIPIKNLQYLSAGIPVISEPLQDVKRLFPEIESGSVYARIEEPEVFTEKIIQVLLDDKLLNQLRVNAVSHISKHFDINNQINKLVGILEEAIEIGKEN